MSSDPKVTVELTQAEIDALKALGVNPVAKVEESTEVVPEVEEETEIEKSPEAVNDDSPVRDFNQDFLKAQLSTKNQAMIRNVLAVISALSVMIVFILEKLGLM